MRRTLLVLTFALASIGCTPPATEAVPQSTTGGDDGPVAALTLTIYDYCTLYPRKCKPCPTGGCVSPPLASLNFCCDPATGVCVPTVLLGDCDPDDYAVNCEWGQTNPDGSITCYDD